VVSGVWIYYDSDTVGTEDFWRYRFLIALGCDRYEEESDFERTLTSLMVDSYVW
jgi:hypothetical protein